MRQQALFLCFCAAVLPAAFNLVPPVYAQAQATMPATVTVSSSYAAEPAVIEHADRVYTYAADGTYIYERSVSVRVQSEAMVRALGVIQVPYASATQQVEFLYARVRHADGSVVESTPADAMEMPAPVTRDAPFYSDLKEKQLPIRGMRSGDTLEWKARITASKAEAPGQFWGSESFTDDAVVLAETLEVRVPEGTRVTVWSPKVKAAESTMAAAGPVPALHVYHWTWSQMKPTVGKEAEAEAEAKKKTVLTAAEELDEEQGKLPSVAWTTFQSWQEVGAWFRTLEQGRTAATPEIKAKVDELIAGKTTEEEKVRAIYAYVSTQIRYIGVAFGIGRYQPHTAAEIFANQYGDCKDKHTLLASMLGAAGVPSDAVLIGAGIRFNVDVPSPASFNHMITHIALPTGAGGERQSIWLDTTEEVAPYRMLIFALRDRQALVVPETGAAEIQRTPVDPPFPSVQTMEANGTIDANGTSHSRISMTFRGDTEVLLRAAFFQASPAQYDQVVQQISKGIGYAGTTSNADVSRPGDTQDAFRMSYDYEREKSGDWADLKIVPQVAPMGMPRPDDASLTRPIDLGAPRVETSKAAMKLPEGWTAILPEAAHFKCDYATYDQTYRLEKGTIHTERRLQILQKRVPVAGLKAYKKFADDADLGNEFFIQLVRHQATGAKDPEAKPDAAPAADASADTAADAAKLITQAYNDVEKDDLKDVQPLLDSAQALSPDHEYYWNTLGYLRFHQNKMEEALADYKKELALHPDATRRMYPVIINTEVLMEQRTEAVQTLRSWIADDETNPTPVLQLIGMLQTQNDPKGAVTVGEAALPHLADGNEKIVVRTKLGDAYIKAGEKQKGSEILEAVLKSTDDPGLLNEAAYPLADGGVDLPLAEASARAALEKMSAESNAWTLDEDPKRLAQQTQFIMATWDTLGWALYREGKLEEAQSYLEAAWRGRPDQEVGSHLATIEEARGEKSAAAETYQTLLASFPSVNAMGVRTAPTDRQKEFQQKLDALRRAGVRTPEGPNRGLQRDRTLPLAASAGRSGTAGYRMLLRDGKAVRVEPEAGKTIAGGEAMIEKTDFSRFFPKGATASLVRNGIVNCHQDVCELFLP